MQLFIYFSIVLVAISSAQQLKNGPQILPEVPSFSEPSQKVDKRYVAPEFNLDFTPEEIQALIAMQSSQNSASSETLKQNPEISEESYNQLIQKFYAENIKPAPIKESQVEQRHSSSKFFLPKEESIYNNKPNFNFNTYRQLLMDQTKLSRHVQSAQKNKSNQLAYFIPAADSNKNEDQKKSVVEKEKEYVLSNGKIYQLNSPNPVFSQNSDRNVGQEKSAVEKEIEDAWRQYLAYEFKRLNSPAEITKQILSAKNKNQKKIEVEKPITYILGNDQAYGYERLNAPTEVTNEGSQNMNEEQNESEVEREIKDFWSKQQNSKLQTSSFPAVVFNQGSSGMNDNKKSEIDKQIENIFKQQDFGFERSYLPSDVSLERPLGKNENLKNLETEKPFEFILRNREAEFEKEKAPEVNNQTPLVTNRDKNRSDVEKEIEDILKKHHDFEFQKSRSTAEAINQSPPIKIHEHVSITKHIPVPVLKTVQVAVPTPVLVPIPQPYEVKVPHLYPVPLKVVKHVPVSLRHY